MNTYRKTMQYIIKKTVGLRPVKITPIKKTEFSKFLKSAPNYTKNTINSSRQKNELGDFYILQNKLGKVDGVILIIDDVPNIWSFAHLPKMLPNDVYELNESLNPNELTEAVTGWELGTYIFNKYKKSTHKFAKLIIPKNANIEEARITIESIFLARDLINTTAADLGPKELATKAEEIAAAFGAKCKIYAGKELLEAGYQSIYTVGRASIKLPYLVDFTWGNEKAQKVTLVGKGVTFDTGGLNIKGEGNMLLMKKDMAGAAIVLGLAKMIMESGINVRLRVLIPTVENSISGEAMRPSDVIKTRAGISVEVTNTDAEGRLILCEPLAEADLENPDLLIDVATLTGAARVAVGAELSAYFSTSNKVSTQLEEASQEAADYVWRLPLWEGYRYMMKASKIADLVNSAESGMGGAITAALFLKEFVTKTTNWIHVDTIAWNTHERAGRPIGGEPMAMRALFQMIKKRYS